MLELDVQSTKDNQLVVLHNATVDSTTNGTGSIADLTLKQVQKLDAGYWYVPDQGITHGADESAYTLRGIRTGDKPVPKGYKRSDFTIPSLAQVFKQFPHTPINIEIKGLSDDNIASYKHTGALLAKFLKKSGRTDVIVVSFNDAVLKAFHKKAPKIGLAPGLISVAAYFLGDKKPMAGTVALQVPVYYHGIQVVTPDFVAKAHADGYAVDVWFDPGYGDDDEATYELVLDAGVDGVMAGRPTLLEQVMKDKGTPRPPKGYVP
jgi:glycerophosphoryl diester phosphodiesterase